MVVMAFISTARMTKRVNMFNMKGSSIIANARARVLSRA
jgi:hypothetical protein